MYSLSWQFVIHLQNVPEPFYPSLLFDEIYLLQLCMHPDPSVFPWNTHYSSLELVVCSFQFFLWYNMLEPQFCTIEHCGHHWWLTQSQFKCGGDVPVLPNWLQSSKYAAVFANSCLAVFVTTAAICHIAAQITKFHTARRYCLCHTVRMFCCVDIFKINFIVFLFCFFCWWPHAYKCIFISVNCLNINVTCCTDILYSEWKDN